MVRAPHATPQLVQLRQAETVCTIDDNRVGRRHVDAALDNCGAKQNVETPVIKIEHDLLEPRFGHLPVTDLNARFGDELCQSFFHALDVLHAVVNEIHLATALDFPEARFADDNVAPFADESFNCQPFGWRRSDQ